MNGRRYSYEAARFQHRRKRNNRKRDFRFVGERPSKRAVELNLKWEEGGLAAAPLFDALMFYAASGCGRAKKNITNVKPSITTQLKGRI
ncbi:MAG: hypothetical protein MSG64_19105 [Pyrinomonadaceae bacterium MAG19_C2-C3]|nr:hypothetical protein [Pyrinomonadaceae bacterium MAG19_C2-C3]